MTFEQALQAALVARLKADPALAALVGNKVFDEIPEDDRGTSIVRPPYVYLGPIGWTRVEIGGAPARAYRVRIYGVSTRAGRIEAWRLVDLVADAIEGAMLEMPEPIHVAEPPRTAVGGDVIDPANPKAAFADFTTILQKL